MKKNTQLHEMQDIFEKHQVIIFPDTYIFGKLSERYLVKIILKVFEW